MSSGGPGCGLEERDGGQLGACGRGEEDLSYEELLCHDCLDGSGEEEQRFLQQEEWPGRSFCGE